MAIRVHLADDRILLREGLEAIFASRAEGIEIVGRSSIRREDAVALIEEHKPDVVIAQIDVDLDTAREVLSRIRSSSPDSRIIVLTMFDNLRYLQVLSKFGIAAYIDKSASSEELLATIDAASRAPDGENVVVSVPRGLLERLDEKHVGALSAREMEIVVLAARRGSNNQIAEELHISEATVKRHLANVYQKIGVGSRSQAVRMALMEQWIGLAEITSANGDGSSGG